MVLGRKNIQKLEDDVFCLTEERNYFQSKYLEQISEISALQSALSNAKREIQKLRQEVISASVASRSSFKEDTKDEDASTLATRLTLEESNERQQVSVGSSSANSEAVPTQKQTTEEEQAEFQVETAKKLSAAPHEIPEEDEEEHASDDEEDANEDAKSTTSSSSEEIDERTKLRMDAEKLLQWADYRSSMTRRDSFSSSTQRSGVPRTIKSTSLKEEVEDEMSMQD
eukprot:scaffold321_cov95-Cylindrotheca_fusiformis.AAC.7